MAKGKKASNVQANKVLPKVPYNWVDFLTEVHSNVPAAPVHLFSNLLIAPHWTSLVSTNLKVEVLNPDAAMPSDVKSIDDCFWIASVVEVAGFFVCLRWEGYELDDEYDFWMGIFDLKIHPVGYAQANEKHLLPPKAIVTKQSDWKKYLFTRLLGSHTLPAKFRDHISESLTSDFKVGMRLEALDINRVSAVRPSFVCAVKGTRLHIGYDKSKPLNETNSIWCDQRSVHIHPVGWAQLVGHELKAPAQYATDSLAMVKTGDYDELDCDFSYFPHLYDLMKEPYIPNETQKFEEGMRIEAIDELNMRTVNVATVFKVLRYDYLMIGIDGNTSDDGSDSFCYYRSECLPINYCKKNKIPLTLPLGYDKKKFNYSSYLKKVDAVAAPESLFKDERPDAAHSFKAGMYLESADLMEPHLICPAFVKQVAGKLLKISFCGWPAAYDQWLDYRSPEIYPMGYCAITGYNLEQPKNTLIEGNNVSDEQPSIKVIKSFIKSKSKGRKASLSTGTPAKRQKISGKSIEKIREMNATQSNSFDVNQDSSNEIIISPAAIYPDQDDESSLRQKNPLQWTVEDVARFWNSINLEQYSYVFLEQQIDGARLVKLKKEEIFKMTGNKLGPSLIVFKKINELKEFHKIGD